MFNSQSILSNSSAPYFGGANQEILGVNRGVPNFCTNTDDPRSMLCRRNNY
jgi:hypothetical protein